MTSLFHSNSLFPSFTVNHRFVGSRLPYQWCRPDWGLNVAEISFLPESTCQLVHFNYFDTTASDVGLHFYVIFKLDCVLL